MPTKSSSESDATLKVPLSTCVAPPASRPKAPGVDVDRTGIVQNGLPLNVVVPLVPAFVKVPELLKIIPAIVASLCAVNLPGLLRMEPLFPLICPIPAQVAVPWFVRTWPFVKLLVFALLMSSAATVLTVVVPARVPRSPPVQSKAAGDREECQDRSAYLLSS